MGEATGSIEVLHAKKGDILIFRCNQKVSIDHFTKFAKTMSEALSEKGIEAVFLSEELDLYAVVE